MGEGVDRGAERGISGSVPIVFKVIAGSDEVQDMGWGFPEVRRCWSKLGYCDVCDAYDSVCELA